MVCSATSCRYAPSIVEALSLTIVAHTSATMALCPAPPALPGPAAAAQAAVALTVEELVVARQSVALVAAVLPPVAQAAVARQPVEPEPAVRAALAQAPAA